MSTSVIQFVPIPTWSFSRLKVFEECKFRAQLQYGQKIPEPERPLPPGKSEHANDRGTRVHTAAEHYVNGTTDILIPELMAFRTEFEAMRKLFAAGVVSLEGDWGMDINWDPTGWMAKDVWQRTKLDAMVMLDDYEAVVIDYKTGKKFGNEIKHGEQTQLYAIDTFLRYPTLEVVTTELWYTDQDDLTSKIYTREQALRFRAMWHRRASAMTTAQDFPANPNIYTCKWCPYSQGENKTGHCERGVSK